MCVCLGGDLLCGWLVILGRLFVWLAGWLVGGREMGFGFGMVDV